MALLVTWEQLTVADTAWSLASGLTAACGLGFFYSAMARGLISLVVPLTAVISATLPVVYGLVRGERPGTPALVGIMLALVAIAIVSATPGSGQALSAAPIVSAWRQGISFGVFIILLSRVSDQAGLWPIALSRSSSSLVLVALALSITGRQSRGIRELLPAGITIGTLEAGGIIAVFLALQRGPISSASVLLSLYPRHDGVARNIRSGRANVAPATRRRRTRAYLSHSHLGTLGLHERLLSGRLRERLRTLCSGNIPERWRRSRPSLAPARPRLSRRLRTCPRLITLSRVEPSEEIRRIVERWTKAVAEGDHESALRRLSEHPGALIIGNDPNEWWHGEEARAIWARQLEELGSFPAHELRSRAWEEGTVGWASVKETITSSGTSFDGRSTYVLHLEGGEWKVVQVHWSLAKANIVPGP